MKKWKLVTEAILVIFVLAFVLLKSTWYMNLKIQRYCDRLEQSYSGQSSLYNAIASNFLNSKETPYYSLDGACHHVTDSMQAQIDLLQQDCSVDIDDIYITDEHDLEYPPDACVFSATVERGGQIYAWVELVYSANAVEQLFNDYQKALEDGIITVLSANWYIMVHYGY